MQDRQVTEPLPGTDLPRSSEAGRDVYGPIPRTNIPSVALPLGVPTPGCEVLLLDADVESDYLAADDSSDSSDDGGDDN